MDASPWIGPGALAAAALLLPRALARLRLSRAKHPSLRGHPRLASRLARLIPNYEFAEHEAFAADGAPPDVEQLRWQAFERLSRALRERAPLTLQRSAALEQGVSDVAFTNAYRVRDLDGNWAFDLSGSYGTNILGYERAKACIERGVERARSLGPVLGSYHPVIADNVERLLRLSGMDEVSFHMSGTEAVMQAVRLARFHTGRRKLVRFCGAYHGWWDGVQPGPGNPLVVKDAYTLREMCPRTLAVLATRRDIACVLVNPLQALHPNGGAANDGMLLGRRGGPPPDPGAWQSWLQALREVCTERGIVLILDEVFLGFRMAPGGVQQTSGVPADLVTYGKALGGGLPVGVLCGKHRFMKRFDERRPSGICFARGTFNSHPYVMTAMNEFLLGLEDPQVAASYTGLAERWDRRARQFNERLAGAGIPVHVAHLGSIWTTHYDVDGPYNWLLQYYLREEGLHLGWIGTARLILSHDLDDRSFSEITERFVRAARHMAEDGWWWQDSEWPGSRFRRRLFGRMLGSMLGARRAVARAGAPAART